MHLLALLGLFTDYKDRFLYPSYTSTSEIILPLYHIPEACRPLWLVPTQHPPPTPPVPCMLRQMGCQDFTFITNIWKGFESYDYFGWDFHSQRFFNLVFINMHYKILFTTVFFANNLCHTKFARGCKICISKDIDTLNGLIFFHRISPEDQTVLTWFQHYSHE